MDFFGAEGLLSVEDMLGRRVPCLPNVQDVIHPSIEGGSGSSSSCISARSGRCGSRSTNTKSSRS